MDKKDEEPGAPKQAQQQTTELLGDKLRRIGEEERKKAHRSIVDNHLTQILSKAAREGKTKETVWIDHLGMDSQNERLAALFVTHCNTNENVKALLMFKPTCMEACQPHMCGCLNKYLIEFNWGSGADTPDPRRA